MGAMAATQPAAAAPVAQLAPAAGYGDRRGEVLI